MQAFEPELPPPLPLVQGWDPEDDAFEEKLAPMGHRFSGRRGMAVVAVVAVVAVAAVAVWVWNSAQGVPSIEVPITTAPRASVPGGNDSADPEAASPAEGLGTAEEPAPEAPPGQTVAPTVTPAVVETAAPHQRFSWSLAALGTLRAARTLTERLGRAAPDQAFIVAPIVSNGRTLYRVLGGLAEDREGILELRDALAQSTGLNASSWFVREAPSAYLIQDFDNQAAAAARAEALWSAGVPVYVLVVGRDDGSSGYRLYAGAYATEEEARPLRDLLQEAGVRDMTFTDRRGRVGR